MATYRIGIGSFSLAENGGVGIGTDSAGLGNLKVEGTVKTTDLDVIGVSTFQRYAGFAADDLNINRDTSLSSEHSTIGDIVVGLNSTFTVSTGATVTVGTVESVSIGTHFSPPTGGVEDRPEVPVEGTVRFNTDLNTLEFYNGVDWRQFTVNNSGASGRALFGGGYATPDWRRNIEYIQMSTKGTAKEFGDMGTDYAASTGLASQTRGVFSGGYKTSTSTTNDDILYVTMASKGNVIDFGNLTSASNNWGLNAASSSTRGIFFGGWPAVNTIEYIEISTLGNASDFADTLNPTEGDAVVNSPTRVVYGGGGGPTGNEKLYTFNQASKGNSIDFGGFIGNDATISSNGTSNSVRGLMLKNDSPAVTYSHVFSVIIASGGNAQYFGDLVKGSVGYAGATGNTATGTRGFYGGGGNAPNAINTIQYFTLETSGNAVDFGDLGLSRGMGGSCSDSHGGLGGY